MFIKSTLDEVRAIIEKDKLPLIVSEHDEALYLNTSEGEYRIRLFHPEWITKELK